MSLPHDLKQKLDRIAHEFAQFAKKTSSGPYEAVLKEAEKIAEKADCDDVYGEDSDGESISTTRPNPSVDGVDVYELHNEKWIPILRRSDRAFDSLCQEFLDALTNDPRAKMDEDEAHSLLAETLFDSFWYEIGEIDGDELESVYDDVRDGCDDNAEYSRDPYAYYGVSRRDFMASRRASRTLTASDRSRLIRLASTMTAGDEMRRAILAGLSKRALSDTLVYGNKDRHGSFFLTSFAFGSTGPEDDAKFLDILGAEVRKAIRYSDNNDVHPWKTESEDGVLTVWWSSNSFSSPNAMDDDDMDFEAYWYFQELMEGAFQETARKMGIPHVKRVGHAADVTAV